MLVLSLLLGHLLVLPILPFLPAEWEAIAEEWLRSRVASRTIPYPIVWFFPAGRFALWAVATTLLACLLTAMPPAVTASPDAATAVASSATASALATTASLLGQPSSSSPLAFLPSFLQPSIPTIDSADDLLLLLYTAGWLVGEVMDLLATRSRSTYFRVRHRSLNRRALTLPYPHLFASQRPSLI